jgi:hypothetical protein
MDWRRWRRRIVRGLIRNSVGDIVQHSVMGLVPRNWRVRRVRGASVGDERILPLLSLWDMVDGNESAPIVRRRMVMPNLWCWLSLAISISAWRRRQGNVCCSMSNCL